MCAKRFGYNKKKTEEVYKLDLEQDIYFTKNIKLNTLL